MKQKLNREKVGEIRFLKAISYNFFHNLKQQIDKKYQKPKELLQSYTASYIVRITIGIKISRLIPTTTR